jgi:hypothetical protein
MWTGMARGSDRRKQTIVVKQSTAICSSIGIAVLAQFYVKKDS